MEITLIYPHQLFARHPAVAKNRPIHLIEDPLFFGNDPHWPTAMHAQKVKSPPWASSGLTGGASRPRDHVELTQWSRNLRGRHFTSQRLPIVSEA